MAALEAFLLWQALWTDTPEPKPDVPPVSKAGKSRAGLVAGAAASMIF